MEEVFLTDEQVLERGEEIEQCPICSENMNHSPTVLVNHGLHDGSTCRGNYRIHTSCMIIQQAHGFSNYDQPYKCLNCRVPLHNPLIRILNSYGEHIETELRLEAELPIENAGQLQPVIVPGERHMVYPVQEVNGMIHEINLSVATVLFGASPPIIYALCTGNLWQSLLIAGITAPIVISVYTLRDTAERLLNGQLHGAGSTRKSRRLRKSKSRRYRGGVISLNKLKQLKLKKGEFIVLCIKDKETIDKISKLFHVRNLHI